MKQSKEQKTNAMRILEESGIPFSVQTYPHGEEAPDGMTVARALGQEPESVFKTLVARGAGGGYYVFEVPVCDELDLKKAARAVGEKSVSMLHVKELFPLTGYVRGGCSPIGMKKRFPTVLQETAQLFDEIAVSAGRIGAQVVLSPETLRELVDGTFADIVKDGPAAP